MATFSIPVRVYYEDTDAAGVVYYANYLKFLERARTEFLRALGYQQDQLAAQENIVFVVRSAQLDYLRPAKFNDELWVTAEIENMRAVSIDFRQQVSKIQAPEEILCTALITVVCVDTRSFRPKVIPESLTQVITRER